MQQPFLRVAQVQQSDEARDHANFPIVSELYGSLNRMLDCLQQSGIGVAPGKRETNTEQVDICVKTEKRRTVIPGLQTVIAKQRWDVSVNYLLNNSRHNTIYSFVSFK